MKNNLFKLFLLFLMGISCFTIQAERYDPDSLRSLLNETRYILAKSYLEEARKEFKEDEDSLLADWHIGYAVVCSILEDQDTAFSSLQTALNIADKLESDYLNFKANTQLIELYRKNRMYERALFLIRKLNQNIKIKDPQLLSRFFHRAAAVYNETPQHYDYRLDQGYTDTAIALSELSLEISTQFGFENDQATSLNELGNIYERTGYLNEALAYYKQSINLWIDQKDIYLANAVKNLGSYYLRRNESDSALHYFKIVINILQECDMDHQIYADTYWGIKMAYEVKGDSMNFLRYDNIEAHHRKILYEEQMSKDIADLAIAYEVKQKELMLQEREKRLLKEQEQRRYIMILLALVAIVISVMVYFIFDSRRKKKQLNRALEKE